MLNVLAIVMLLMAGYSGYINPVNHSLWSLAGFVFPAVLVVNVGFVVVWACVKKRYLLVPIAGLCIAYWPIKTYVPVNFGSDPPEDALKVLSFNILGFNLEDAPEEGPNPIFKYVIESKADIVCMQEYSVVCVNDPLWEKCKELYPYRDTLRCRSYRGSDYVAVFSKFPIVSKEHLPIKTVGNCAGSFTLDIKGRKVCVVNLHLETVGLTREEKENFSEIVHGKTERDSVRHDSHNLVSKVAKSSVIRSAQADVTHDFIRRKLAEMRSATDPQHIDGGIILCGDFNDHPLSYVHHRIADELTDCFVESGCGLGFTMHYNSMHFRIDNIMCSSNWQPYGCTVDKSVSLSDHYPVYCFLKLKNDQ